MIIKERLVSAFIAILFIAVFQPFGLLHFGLLRWALLAGFSVIIVSSCLFSEVIVAKVFGLDNDVTRGTKYIITRNLIFEGINIFLLTVMFTLYLDRFVNNKIIDNHFSLRTVANVLIVNVFTSIIIHVYWRNLYKKRMVAVQLEEAKRLSGMLEERWRQARLKETIGERGNESQATATRLCLSGTTKEKVEMFDTDFLYAESDANYVHIHYMYEGKEKNTMLRSTIKDVAESITGLPDIIRCHRAFIVNLSHV
ncbi:MAG: LytTR family transcriptional regulator DNA-binding domain-containing protein, partial [Prevotella sp.]